MARIVWADPAIQDLEAIADYIALDNPEAARRLVRDVLRVVLKLRKFPRMGSVPHELRGLPYRQLVISPCRVFYRVEESTVFIVHVQRSEQLVRLADFPADPSPATPRKMSSTRRRPKRQP